MLKENLYLEGRKFISTTAGWGGAIKVCSMLVLKEILEVRRK